MQNVTDLMANLSPAKRALLLQHLYKSKRPANFASPQDVEKKTRGGNLSFGQQRLWFLQQLEPESFAYNYPVVIGLEGHLRMDVLQEAIREVVQRHEPLRSNFDQQGGEPFQFVNPSTTIDMEVLDLTQYFKEQRCQIAKSFASKEAQRPFDLRKDRLFRVRLLKLGNEQHQIVIVTHHIVFDGWSLGIFIRELSLIYQSLLGNCRSLLKEITFTYSDYAAWQRCQLQGRAADKLLEFWRKHLEGAPSSLMLPVDRSRPQQGSFRGAQQTFSLSSQLSNDLKILAQREGVSLFMLLLTAFKTMLYGYTRQTDLVVGTDTANRPLVETESLIGFFVNILILRNDLSGNPQFLELLARVRETTLQAYEHESVPFEKLVEVLRPERVPGYTPLVQALFLLQNMELGGGPSGGLKWRLLELENATTKFDLVFSIAENERGLAGVINYSTDLFEETTIGRMRNHFQRLLEEVTLRPTARLKDLTGFILEKRNHPMTKIDALPGKFSKLNQIKRKSVNVTSSDLVVTHVLREGWNLPLVLSPAVDDVDLAEWALSNGKFIDDHLLKHGALLFRGFNIGSSEEFEAVASAVCGELFGEYNDLPREEMGKKVYGSTPYPRDQTILFHNESSHLHRWPMKQWFYCVTAAAQGGETPLVDCREIYRQLDPALIELFEKKKLCYVRNFIEGLDVSWHDFFKTTDRAVVEAYCRSANLEYVWKGETGLKISSRCPAVTTHPRTGEKVFFNQVQLHHISTLSPAIRQSMTSVFSEDDLPRNVFFGDGSPIEDAVIEEITALYWKLAVSFPWREGDIIFLDNMLTAHARNPFVGPRKILVAMGEMIRSAENSQ